MSFWELRCIPQTLFGLLYEVKSQFSSPVSIYPHPTYLIVTSLSNWKTFAQPVISGTALFLQDDPTIHYQKPLTNFHWSNNEILFTTFKGLPQLFCHYQQVPYELQSWCSCIILRFVRLYALIHSIIPLRVHVTCLSFSENFTQSCYFLRIAQSPNFPESTLYPEGEMDDSRNKMG